MSIITIACTKLVIADRFSSKRIILQTHTKYPAIILDRLDSVEKFYLFLFLFDVHVHYFIKCYIKVRFVTHAQF